MGNSIRQYSKVLTILCLAVCLGRTSKAYICTDILTIDSLAQMKEYNFIAHVKIIDDKVFKKPSKGDYETIGQLTFEIIDLFKGERINKILEYSKNTSCDIGVSKDEEWILFGRIINGSTSIVACDRNKRYREVDEQRDWKYGRGFYELNKLRILYGHAAHKFENEKRKEQKWER